uniref:Hypotheticial protein n=1 Tax=Schistosoma japonicum TaxID=6182 RepID=C7TY09_SCHJA|nr:hypotheticial protein [Schistosoma japonicum]
MNAYLIVLIVFSSIGFLWMECLIEPSFFPRNSMCREGSWLFFFSSHDEELEFWAVVSLFSELFASLSIS